LLDWRITIMLRTHGGSLRALAAVLLFAAGLLPALGGQEAPERKILAEALAANS
jgi:hypothetical protein